MLRTIVKASRIQHLTDARYFAAWNVDYLGFSLDTGTPGAVSPKQLQEIRGWVAGVKVVGEFGIGQTPVEIQQAIELSQLDAVELPPFYNIDDAQHLHNTQIIKCLNVDGWDAWNDLLADCDAWGNLVEFFVLDLSQRPDVFAFEVLQTQPERLALLQALCASFPVMLQITCEADNLNVLLEMVRPYGLNLVGGEEEKVGVKSFDELDDVLNVLGED